MRHVDAIANLQCNAVKEGIHDHEGGGCLAISLFEDMISGGGDHEHEHEYEYSFKVLMVGDSGVGKSTLLLSFIDPSLLTLPQLTPTPTVGVDFKIKHLALAAKSLKLTIWDTAGQERFGTLIASYYRGAHGVMLVYDVTNRDSFINLRNQWAPEVDLYSTEPHCVKIVVANKHDTPEEERAVSREEGISLARDLNCAFYECTAKTTLNVTQCFQDLTLKLAGLDVMCQILEVPSLLDKGRAVVRNQQIALTHNYYNTTAHCCCFN